MARYNDASPHPDRWTDAKLMREARKYANLEGFSMWVYDGIEGKGDAASDAIREATRNYRDSWLNPILDEIEKRFVK